jgi:hypothetical protein
LAATPANVHAPSCHGEEERIGKVEKGGDMTNRPHMLGGSKGLNLEIFAEVGEKNQIQGEPLVNK